MRNLPFNIFVLQFSVRIKLCWQRYHFLAYLWTLHFSNIVNVVRFHFQYMQYKLFFRRKNFVALAYMYIYIPVYSMYENISIDMMFFLMIQVMYLCLELLKNSKHILCYYIYVCFFITSDTSVLELMHVTTS